MMSRRELLGRTGGALIATTLNPLSEILGPLVAEEREGTIRSINVINFLRGTEPRGPMDLFLPLQKQMEISKTLGLPTTWLLQFDALVSGPFVPFLKEQMPSDHEVGVWFEMNRPHCEAAGVKWRGRPRYDWDHYPDVAFTIGYTPEERIKLVDAFMSEFQRVWGRRPKSVASWNLDSISMDYMVKRYGVDAFAVCRDQIATDGFTIWGAPIAGYFPSKRNAWSPALSRKEQIGSPVFRMLGQDPVYYYQNGYPMPGGRRGGGPDTMEPVWPSGRSPEFIQNFLDMIAKGQSLRFAYAQLGQENNFGWPEMQEAYPKQMRALADLRKSGRVHVETMGDTGRRFKRAFRETPPQVQAMLVDPFGNTEPVENSIWYQSRFYRADLHIQGDRIYIRDLTIYSDHFPQPFLTEATRLHDVEQRMPAVLDGFHWSPSPGSAEPGAGGFFTVDGVEVRLAGRPVVRESGSSLTVDLPLAQGKTLRVLFREDGIEISLPGGSFTLEFRWDLSRSPRPTIAGRSVSYRWQDFEYAVTTNGRPVTTDHGWKLESTNREGVRLKLAQSR